MPIYEIFLHVLQHQKFLVSICFIRYTSCIAIWSEISKSYSIKIFEGGNSPACTPIGARVSRNPSGGLNTPVSSHPGSPGRDVRCADLQRRSCSCIWFLEWRGITRWRRWKNKKPTKSYFSKVKVQPVNSESK